MFSSKIVSATLKIRRFSSMITSKAHITQVHFPPTTIKYSDLKRLHTTSLDATKPISETNFKRYVDYLPTLVKRILDDEHFEEISAYDKQWFREILEYNLPYGYKRTPHFALSAYHTIEKPENITEQNLKLAHMIIWSINMAQWSYQIIDDITDGTDTRGNKPCWYKKEGIGLNAINDATLLSGIPLILLKRYFSQHGHYHEMVELFNLVNLLTMFGQRLDCTKYSWDQITVDRWKTILQFKTFWHQCILPFKTVLFLTNTYDAEKFKRMEPLLVDFAILYQMMNDFEDGFPKKESLGVNATDIQEGKGSWLLVHALQMCSLEQRRIIEQNYGKVESSCVKKVLDVYNELNLREYGEKFKNELYDNIQRRIDELPDDYPRLALKNGLIFGHNEF